MHTSFDRSAGALRAVVLAGAVLFAPLAAAPAFAQTWNAIHIHPEEEFHRTESDLRLAPGDVLRWSLATPAGITQLRVELAGDNGNGNLKVYQGSPNATPACDLRGPGTMELCTQGWAQSGATTLATTWYIEVTATAAFDNAALTASYLPRLEAVDNLPDLPFSIARRGPFQNDHAIATTCMQPRFQDTPYGLPEVACMPVGKPQSWHFEMGHDKEYRIRNAWTDRCLADNNGGAIEDRPCTSSDAGQRWRVLGGAGMHHLVVLQNAGNDQCADFDPGTRVTMFVPCRLGEADMPLWALRDFNDRVRGAMAEDGATFSLIAGVQCLADDGTKAFLADCNDRTATRRVLFPAVFGASDIDWWSGNFQIVSVTDWNRCMTAEATTGVVVFRDCGKGEAAQEWTPELWGGKASEWQLRNVATKQCLVSRDKGSSAGTELVLGDCAANDTTTRWRYVGL